MIKTCLSALLVLSLFGSCHKAALNTPDETPVTYSLFKDDHIALVAFKMEQSAPRQVTINFTTRYEKDLKSIEVYSGSTTKNLCSMHEEKSAGESHQLKTYRVVHDPAAGGVNYYMVKYTTVGGAVSYSPIYQIQMK